MPAKKPSGKFVFRKHQSIGAADALEDEHFLAESFIDTGDLDVLRDTGKPNSIVLGRTGAGKTALLHRLSLVEEHVIRLDPEDLALAYLANNNVLQFFIAAGVNMELFYRLLWRHIIAVEVVKERFRVVDEISREGFLQNMRNLLRGKRAKENAINYLMQWGKTFWEETDYRVREITSKLESDLTRSAGLAVGGSLGHAGASFELSASSANRLSEEQRAEVISRGQKVVNEVQIAELSKVIELLDEEILDDPQQRFYVTIDGLDENWVPDETRYDLIKALLEASRVFNNRVRNMKVIIALREDLIDRVFRYTRDSGYQEEKFRSLVLPITWNEERLVELLDRRVDQLIREQYTGQRVTLRRLLPNDVLNKDSIGYIIERTMLRPRDVISFFNKCMELAEGRPRITQGVLLNAEGVYSLERLRALADEWSADYPRLIEFCFCLKGLPQHFKIAEVEEELIERVVKVLTEQEEIGFHDRTSSELLEHFVRDDVTTMGKVLMTMLYRVGLIGVKPQPYLGVHWGYKGDKVLHLEDSATYHVHPAFHRVLGISPR